MAIASPIYSFVDFNDPILDCKGNERDVALPVYETFAIKFQIKVVDEKIPRASNMFAAACTEECTILYNPDVMVLATCDRFVIQNAADNVALVAADFPVNVTNTTDYISAGSYSQADFIAALKDYDEQIQALDYISCCVPAALDLGITLTTAGGSAYTLELGDYWGYGYVVFPADDVGPYLGFNDCFRYCILDSGNAVLNCSNLFYRISDPCLTTVFNYYNEENGYDFKYTLYDDGGVSRITENQIRLSVFFDKPTRLIEENIFRQSNKVQQRLSTLIEKEWQGHTSYLSDDQHDKVVVMLKADVLHVDHENRGMDRRMIQIGDYDDNYPDMNNPKTHLSLFKIRDYLYAYNNNNCGFNCGIEVIDPCDDGGVEPECPDKYSVEFVVGAPGSPMAEGDTVYSDPNISQSQNVEVYREGLLQHNSGENNVVFTRGANPSLPGTITFTPSVITNERIAIWEV